MITLNLIRPIWKMGIIIPPSKFYRAVMNKKQNFFIKQHMIYQHNGVCGGCSSTVQGKDVGNGFISGTSVRAEAQRESKLCMRQGPVFLGKWMWFRVGSNYMQPALGQGCDSWGRLLGGHPWKRAAFSQDYADMCCLTL